MGLILKHGELAEALDINPGQLTTWRKSGMPFVSDTGARGGAVTYDMAAVFRWMRDAGRFQGEEGEEGGALVPAVENAKLAKARRIKVDLDTRVKSGELVSARKVQQAVFPVVRAMRDGLLGIPDRMASTLAASADESEIHALLLAELRETLDNANDELQAVAASLTNAPAEGEGEGVGDDD